MNKYWAVLLLAIAATQAFAGEKEYTVRYCDKSATQKSCDKCKEWEKIKVSFKVSKELKSVMRNYTTADSVNHIDVIENCKIFDENNIQCETKTAAEFKTHEWKTKNGDFYYNYNYGAKNTFTIVNGTWEQIFDDRGTETNYGRTAASFWTECGYEIKNVFNFFK
jgi:hypothetical protein